MRFTAIRIRKLISGPGYNNQAIEAEVAVESWEHPGQARANLSQWIEQELGKMRERDAVVEDVQTLLEQKRSLEIRREYLTREVDALQKASRELEQQQELAIEPAPAPPAPAGEGEHYDTNDEVLF